MKKLRQKGLIITGALVRGCNVVQQRPISYSNAILRPRKFRYNFLKFDTPYYSANTMEVGRKNYRKPSNDRYNLMIHVFTNTNSIRPSFFVLFFSGNGLKGKDTKRCS